MNIAAAVFLIALGAILKYAVTASVAGISLATVGVILMIAGIIGLVVTVVMARATTSDATDPRPHRAA